MYLGSRGFPFQEAEQVYNANAIRHWRNLLILISTTELYAIVQYTLQMKSATLPLNLQIRMLVKICPCMLNSFKGLYAENKFHQKLKKTAFFFVKCYLSYLLCVKNCSLSWFKRLFHQHFNVLHVMYEENQFVNSLYIWIISKLITYRAGVLKFSFIIQLLNKRTEWIVTDSRIVQKN